MGMQHVDPLSSENADDSSGPFTIVQHGDQLDSEGRLEFTIQCDVCGSKGVPMFKDGGLDKEAMDAFRAEHVGCG